MFVDKLGEIKAIGFDIDGTLYRTWKLNIRVWPHVLCHLNFFLNYSKVRKIMHQTEGDSDFKNQQIRLMAEKLNKSVEETELLLQKNVYSGMRKHFTKIRPCKGVVQLIKDLKQAGYKIAILSDFPPEQKGDIWGIRDLCDVILGSEEAGALKPANLPFKTMAQKLDIPAENILYVGNSHKYDIDGSKAAGMKSAWLVLPLSGRFKKSDKADIVFWSYKQLRKILLKK